MLNPAVAVRLMLCPAQTAVFESEILAVGKALTVTLAVAVLVQLPLPAVTVKLNPPALLLLNVASLVVLLNAPPGFDQL